MNLENNSQSIGLEKFYQGCKNFASLSLTLLALILLIRIAEFFYNGLVHQFPQPFFLSLLGALVNSIALWTKHQLLFWLLHALIYQFSSSYGNKEKDNRAYRKSSCRS